MKRLTFILVFLLFISGLAYGQAGYLDKTFGDGGVVTISPNNFNTVIPQDVKILPDGRILHCGGTELSSLYVMMHKADGSIDSSFGTSGYSISENQAGIFGDSHLCLLQDGKILVYAVISGRPIVMRFLADGRIDSSFGKNGECFASLFKKYCSFRKIKEHSDGSLTAVGVADMSSDLLFGSRLRPVITKITTEGQIDTSFGDQGVVIIGSSSDTGYVYDVLFTRSGQMIVALSLPESNKGGLHMIKCDLSGMVDSTFGENGRMRMQLSDGVDMIHSLIETRESNIISLVETTILGKKQSLLLKFSKDGILDESFGDKGIAGSVDLSYDRYMRLCSIDSNNNIMIAGEMHQANVGERSTTIRYIQDGEQDSSYGVSGVSFQQPSDMKGANAMAIQQNGKYVIVGYNDDGGRYTGRMYRLDNMEVSGVSQSVSFSTSISIHPTPSTDNCTVTYTLPNNTNCSIMLRDESGREVKSFMMGEYKAAGKHEEELDLRGLASGVYFLEIASGGTIQTTKLIKQ